MHPSSLFTASVLLGLSLIPLLVVLVAWRERMRNADLQAQILPDVFGEWMRIVERGPEIGKRDQQPIFDWLRVELLDKTLVDLRTEKPFSVPPGFRPVRLAAGQVIYWGLAPESGSRTEDFALPCSHDEQPSRTSRHKGFSLIELMVVVALIGILSAIAIPVYNRYVEQSAAKPVQAALLQLAQQLDAYAQDHNTYVGGCASVPAVQNATLSCVSTSATDYLIEAQGSGPIAGLTYTLTKSGARATPGPAPGWPTSASCWIVDASGDCS